jgi:L-2-hydroxycarboxylate dehydrogenase (NAD+)
MDLDRLWSNDHNVNHYVCRIVCQYALLVFPVAAPPAHAVNALVQLPIDLVAATAGAVFDSCDTPRSVSAVVIDNLIEADRRGIHTHGIARVPMYLQGVEAGAIDPGATATVEYEAPAASCWNANHAFGQIAIAELVDHACDQAKQVGSHVAVVHGSNHFGYAGHWVRRAADRGMVAMAFSSGGPLVIPTGGARPELGTNPLAFAARSRRDEVVLDMSTSAVAMGKLELAHRAGTKIPKGWAVDSRGEPLEAPEELIENLLTGQAGGLLPLGGHGTESGGHKGYGMGLMVEVLCSVLSGGEDIRVDRDADARYEGHISHCVIVIDPAHLAGVEPTHRALNRLTGALRDSPPVDSDCAVRVAGDPEREYENLTDADHVLIESTCWAELGALAARTPAGPPRDVVNGIEPDELDDR